MITLLLLSAVVLAPTYWGADLCRSKPWDASQCERGVKAFKTEAEYGAFIWARLRSGTRLVAVSGSRKGEKGVVIECNSSSSSCSVQWNSNGWSKQVVWRDVELEVRPIPVSRKGPHTLNLAVVQSAGSRCASLKSGDSMSALKRACRANG